jgi:heme exporter protein D
MYRVQRPAILFQVAGLRKRVARLPRRGRLALALVAGVALAWLLGLPQAGYRHLYVWLAYPVELVVDSTQTLTN